MGWADVYEWSRHGQGSPDVIGLDKVRFPVDVNHQYCQILAFTSIAMVCT